jgi:tetratricopeptide (TPR) repeat protein
MKATIKLSLVLFSSVLASCASQPPLIDAELLAHEGVESSLALEKVNLPLKKIPRESLYDLLVGDVALSRNQFDTALAKYSHQARVTSDQEVIKLALRIAEHLEDQPTRMEMARLWLELVPNSAEARRAALDTFMASGHILDALDQGSWLYQNRDDLDAFIFVSTAPVASLQLFTAIIDHLATLSLSDEKKPIIQFIEAIFYQKSNQVIEAETKVREFLALRGKDQRGLLLLAQLLHQQQKKDEAIAILEEALEDDPSARKLRLQYARFLAADSVDEAIVQFKLLQAEDPDDQEVSLLLGLLRLSQNKFDLAIPLFEQASNTPSLRANAQYHLGTIAERQKRIVDAINHYTQVRFGRNYIVAASRVSTLLATHRNISEARQYLQRLRYSQPKQAVSLFQVESSLLISLQQPAQALQILSSGLETFPNDPELLYARSMVAEQQDNFALAESDLRLLLAQDKNNATILNALGYTMALHTDRQQEAYDLIIRAYNLSPESPSIIDSLGWVLFKLGRTPEALTYLEQAYTMVPDPEIAAHLGEVYWALGNSERALALWSQTLDQYPNHRAIVQTMLRLGASASITP